MVKRLSYGHIAKHILHTHAAGVPGNLQQLACLWPDDLVDDNILHINLQSTPPCKLDDKCGFQP
jgi:hypothetical protein